MGVYGSQPNAMHKKRIFSHASLNKAYDPPYTHLLTCPLLLSCRAEIRPENDLAYGMQLAAKSCKTTRLAPHSVLPNEASIRMLEEVELRI